MDDTVFPHELPADRDYSSVLQNEQALPVSVTRPRRIAILVGSIALSSLLLFLVSRSWLLYSFSSVTSPLPDEQVSSTAVGPVSQPRMSPYSPSQFVSISQNLLGDARLLSANLTQNEEDRKEIILKLTKAIETISEGITLYPKESTLWATRAEIYLALTKTSPRAFDQAIQDLSRAHSLAPGYVGVTKKLAYLYLQRGETDTQALGKAFEYLLQAKTYAPADTQLLTDLANLQMRLGYLPQARDTLLSLLSLTTEQTKRQELLQEKESIDLLLLKAGANVPSDNTDDIQHDRNILSDEAQALPLLKPEELLAGTSVIVAADTWAPSPYQETFTSSAYTGTGAVVAGQKTVTIDNVNVSDSAPVYVVPIDNVNATLFVTRKYAGVSFTVSLDSPRSYDVPFRYWVTRE